MRSPKSGFDVAHVMHTLALLDLTEVRSEALGTKSDEKIVCEKHQVLVTFWLLLESPTK